MSRERSRSALPVVLAAGSVLAATAFSAPATADPDASGGPMNPVTTAEQRWVPGEVLVRFAPQVAAAGRRSARAAVSGRPTERLPVPGLERLEVEGSVPAAVRALERRPGVLYAEPNYVYTTQRTPNDPRFPQQWGLHNTGQRVEGRAGTVDADIDAPEAWDLVTGDRDVVVAVVDSGVSRRHPEIRPNLWRNADEDVDGRDDDGNGHRDDVRGWDFVQGDNDPTDLNGHGTHVAGTIGANGNDQRGMTGVAWDVRLMPVRVLGADGSGTTADIVEGLSYAADEGADVVNVSLGGPGWSRTMRDAIAQAPDTLFVAAAGNEGSDNDVDPSYPCNYALANIVCVAATDNRDQLPPWSNRGLGSVDLAAPGAGVLGPVPYVTLRSDTFTSRWTDRWTSGGTRRWGTELVDGNRALSDSPGTRYARRANSWVRMRQAMSFSGLRRCAVEYWLDLKSELGVDGVVVEHSVGGGRWRYLTDLSGNSRGWVPVRHGLGRLDGQRGVRLGFRLVSNGSIQYDGAKIDDLVVKCDDPRFTRNVYDVMSGTSMAAPHVSGAAALLLSVEPDASVAALREALLDGVDQKPDLAGVTVTGGRLNVRSSLDLLAPPAP